jgi:hypothetical protein
LVQVIDRRGETRVGAKRRLRRRMLNRGNRPCIGQRPGTPHACRHHAHGRPLRGDELGIVHVTGGSVLPVRSRRVRSLASVTASPLTSCTLPPTKVKFRGVADSRCPSTSTTIQVCEYRKLLTTGPFQRPAQHPLVGSPAVSLSTPSVATRETTLAGRQRDAAQRSSTSSARPTTCRRTQQRDQQQLDAQRARARHEAGQEGPHDRVVGPCWAYRGRGGPEGSAAFTSPCRRSTAVTLTRRPNTRWPQRTARLSRLGLGWLPASRFRQTPPSSSLRARRA